MVGELPVQKLTCVSLQPLCPMAVAAQCRHTRGVYFQKSPLVSDFSSAAAAAVRHNFRKLLPEDHRLLVISPVSFAMRGKSHGLVLGCASKKCFKIGNSTVFSSGTFRSSPVFVPSMRPPLARDVTRR